MNKPLILKIGLSLGLFFSVDTLMAQVCPFEHVEEHETSDVWSMRMQDNHDCSLVQIAFVVDQSLVQKLGSTEAVESEVKAIITQLDLLYAPFIFKYKLTQLYVAAQDEVSPDSNLEASSLLDNFKDWANVQVQVPHDVGIFLTARDLNYHDTLEVAGLAYQNRLCKTERYGVIEHFTSNVSHLSILIAHEIGHLWGAKHTSQNTVNIMAPLVTNNNTEWSVSNSQIVNATKVAQATCFSFCDPPIADFTLEDRVLCVGETVTLSNLTTNNPDFFQWSFDGANINSSNLSDPTLTYMQEGKYQVTLIATNDAGWDTLKLDDFIEVVTRPIVVAGTDEITVTTMDTIQFQVDDTHADTLQWDVDGDDTVDIEGKEFKWRYNIAGTYEAVLRAVNEGCALTDTVRVFVTQVSGLEEAEGIATYIENGRLYLGFPKNGTYQVEIYTVQGQIIYTSEVLGKVKVIPVSMFSDGVYVINVKGVAEVQLKIQIQKSL